MKILSLNCQKGYQPGLESFLHRIVTSDEYDFILLQEVTEAVRPLLEARGAYRLLDAYDEIMQWQSQLVILYRPSHTLRDPELLSFGRMRPDFVKRFSYLGFGMLVGAFAYESGSVTIGSVHLHAGTDGGVRVAELKQAKEKLLGLAQQGPILIGGDFNFGYPGELARGVRTLEPELVCATRTLGGTLDSRYSEYAKHFPNQLAHLFAKAGLGIKLKTDHFFANRALTESAALRCRILPDRVSDHSPIELSYI